MDISQKDVIEYFGLDETTIKGIFKHALLKMYEKNKGRIRREYLPMFLRKLSKFTPSYILPSETEPFALDKFETYFIRTYCALCQVLGEDCGLTLFLVDYMILAVFIQHPTTNVLFDFATILQTKLCESLVKAKDEKIAWNFKYYSLVCHLLLY